MNKNSKPYIISSFHSVAPLLSLPDEDGGAGGVSAETERNRTDQSFLVPFSEIKENDWDLSINRYKEIVYEEIQYDAPEDIIAAIVALDKQRFVALKNLKEMLK